MSTQVLMPALSPTMTEGKLSKWHVKVGDEVKAGQVICEIETDKATMEVEAVDEGTVAKILVEEGTEGVAVNTPICVLAGEGEDAGTAAASAATPTCPSTSSPAAGPAPTRSRRPSTASPRSRPAAASTAIWSTATRSGSTIRWP